MTEPAVLAALVAVGASLLAISGRDTRLVVGGLLVAMIAAPLAASPEPSGLTIAFRVAGSLLAAYLLWMAARTESTASDGSGIGIAAEAVIAAAAFAVGWFVAPVKPLAGPLAAQAGAFSLAALAIVPLTGRNVMRAGAAAAILVLSFSMLLVAWVGPISALEQLVLMVLVVSVVGGAGLLSSSKTSASEPADLSPEGVDAAEAAEPAETGSTEPREPLTEETLTADRAPEPDATPDTKPASASATIRTSRSRSPRAARKAAPSARPEAEVEPEDLSGTPGPQPAAQPATPPTARVRLIRPREPRQ